MGFVTGGLQVQILTKMSLQPWDGFLAETQMCLSCCLRLPLLLLHLFFFLISEIN